VLYGGKQHLSPQSIPVTLLFKRKEHIQILRNLIVGERNIWSLELVRILYQIARLQPGLELGQPFAKTGKPEITIHHQVERKELIQQFFGQIK
jgi:hypothetical protein